MATKKNAGDFTLQKGKETIAMLTAYTCPIARCLENAGIDVLLVGDTWGMVEMGFSTTRQVTMDQMCDHIAAVRRGAPNVHIIGDMPFDSDREPELALKNALRFLESGADSVKLEGPKFEVIEYLISNRVEICGHTGLTPQTSANFRQVGRSEQDAQRVLAEAAAFAKMGCFMVVLEHIPSDLGKKITRTIAVPTIGIGAGPDCDGQVLVINDLVGLGDYWPPFSKQYLHLDKLITEAARQYAQEVKSRVFPENAKHEPPTFPPLEV
jgi:3-methyl-2-oxobutanoate hydroxymethyltransferase